MIPRAMPFGGWISMPDIRRLVVKKLPVPLSAVLAAVFLYPGAAYMLGMTPHVGWYIYAPAMGLDYLSVFFHEIGHAVAGLLFGAPGMPTFDFEYGGGFTFGGHREWLTQAIVWAVLVTGIVWLYRQDGVLQAKLASAILLLLLPLSFNDGWQDFVTAMGHGTEILIGCFCLFRGLTNSVESGDHSSRLVERYLNLIFGFFALGRNATRFSALAFIEEQQAVYDMQKGGHALGDLRRLSDSFDMTLSDVASAALAITATAFIFTLAFSYYWGLRIEDEGA